VLMRPGIALVQAVLGDLAESLCPVRTSPVALHAWSAIRGRGEVCGVGEGM
jgi:hypothetical protein